MFQSSCSGNSIRCFHTVQSSPKFSSISDRLLPNTENRDRLLSNSETIFNLLGLRQGIAVNFRSWDTWPLHRAIYRAGMRRKVVRDRERGEAGNLCEAREEKLRDSYSTFLHTHLVVSSLVHDDAPLCPPRWFVLLSFAHGSSFSIHVRVGKALWELYVIPARPRERIKRVFVRARASCLSNTSYLPEVSGDSVTSPRERRSIHGPRSTFHVPARSTVLLKPLFGQRLVTVYLGVVVSSSQLWFMFIRGLVFRELRDCVDSLGRFLLIRTV